MSVRKTVMYVEEIESEFGAKVSPPLKRVAVGSVIANPLAGKPAGTDLKPLIELSEALGESMTRRALAVLGNAPLRAYGKAAIVGVGGDLEHGAAMIHPRIGMAMRRTIRKGRVIIPGNAKVAAPGTAFDLIFGPMDAGWDLDAVDTMPLMVPDAPRPTEILVVVGYATGPRPNARSKGPDQAEVDALIATFK
jgi:hypothetical protein